MRFSLIDQITAIEAGKSLEGHKNLSMAEEYLADHFPGFSVMPGVMMLECLVQASAWLIRHTDDFQHSTILLKQARAVKFNSFVTPGETLNVAVQLKKQSEGEYSFVGKGSVRGRSTVSAKLTLECFNLADRTPGMEEMDERTRTHMREIFGQIWRQSPEN